MNHLEISRAKIMKRKSSRQAKSSHYISRKLICNEQKYFKTANVAKARHTLDLRSNKAIEIMHTQDTSGKINTDGLQISFTRTKHRASCRPTERTNWNLDGSEDYISLEAMRRGGEARSMWSNGRSTRLFAAVAAAPRRAIEFRRGDRNWGFSKGKTLGYKAGGL